MAESYKFGGSKDGANRTARLILEGSSVDPKRFVDVGGSLELSDDEVTKLRSQGYKFTKSGDSEDTGASSEEPDSKTEQQAQQAAGAVDPTRPAPTSASKK